MCAGLIRMLFFVKGRTAVGKKIISKSGGNNYDKCSVVLCCLVRVEQSYVIYKLLPAVLPRWLC